MRPIQPSLIPCVCLLVLGACGGSPEPAAPAAPATPAAGETPVAESNLPPLRCPARLADTPDGPDVIGLRLGMSHADALALVRCHTKDAGYTNFPTRWFDRLETYGLELGPQAISVMTGDTEDCSFRSFSDMQRCGPGNRVWLHTAEAITVATPGLPGRETVVGIWRTQHFREQEQPPVEALAAALAEKYGTPHARFPQSDRHDLHAWGWDAAGMTMTRQHPLYAQCVMSGANPRGTDGQSWGEGCGLSIKALLVRSRTNPDLAEEISVGMLHQQQLWDYQQGFEQGLRELDARRRRQELDRAKDNANVQL